ncbi:MAG: sulfatase-like hydrolase/transferase [Planctomycetaceae bacterium]|nr:sulfatase-like hydrolase/transferase [Planctomycetaceae bacterium]
MREFDFLRPVVIRAATLVLAASIVVLFADAQQSAPKGPAYPQEATPNIVVIMADDLGYGDLSCYGATEIQTPHIDSLAASGVRFTSGYCSSSTCTPTRYSFITGNYAFRTPGTGVAPPNAPAIIQPGSVTIASLLRDAGYQTAVIGKWHLGLGEKGTGPNWNGALKPGPLEIGFHSCFLLPTTNDRVPQVYVDDHRVANLDPNDPLWVGDKRPSADHPTGLMNRESLRMNWSHGHDQTIHNGISRIGFYTGGHDARFRDEDLADKWVERSVQFIETNRDRPFFLFFASHDIHVPRVPHERFAGKSKLGYRGDCILQLDWCVGEIVATLERLKLRDHTLIVFCSDNGPVMDDGYQDLALERLGSHRAAGPFRGGKYSVFEGGTRTPFLTSWPGQVEPAVSDEIVGTIDLAHSFAALAGQTLPAGACGDSFNVLDALLNKSGAKGRDHVLQQNNNGNQLGLRVRENGRDWKLILSPNKQAYNLVVEETLRSTAVPEIQLFDLQADPGERHNLAEQNPEVVKRMRERLAAIKTGEGSRPSAQ